MDIMDMQIIQGLMSLFHQQATDKGWWDKPRNDGELIALMHSELSEALEALRQPGIPGQHLPHLDRVGVEMADTVIRIFDYCAARDIDLAQCMLEKYRYNETRPHKHGGKKF